MPIQSPTNQQIADALEQIADLLEQRDDNPFRVQAFRTGAKNVRATSTPLVELVEREGASALKQIEGIGQGLATTIFELIQTGRSSYLQQLRASQSPVETFQRVPGIGPQLARRINEQLGIDTLESLEQAAHDGRLQQVNGFGPNRVEAVRHSLASILRRSESGRRQPRPPVDLLLEVDADYRRRAEADALPKLAPRRFNPNNEAWLPVMRTERAGWSMTVLFSNTARAHELQKTDDWVIIYYEKDGSESQDTVVTETGGPLQGKRVIRGRERECLQFYRDRQG
jgi:DNA uptake protein ComE-like DNA-binding protein